RHGDVGGAAAGCDVELDTPGRVRRMERRCDHVVERPRLARREDERLGGERRWTAPQEASVCRRDLDGRRVGGVEDPYIRKEGRYAHDRSDGRDRDPLYLGGSRRGQNRAAEEA